MMGVHLPEGAIIGANTVVLRGVTYLPNGIYAGAPARLIRMR
jgi:acetyltransferase-like isoleucine patch superfamily enzyme